MLTLTPDIGEFIKKSSRGNLVPIYKEIFADMETPVSAFKKVDDGSNAFLLESVEGGEKWGRYSFIGVKPRIIFKSIGRRIEIIEKGRSIALESNPVEMLKDLMARFIPVETEGLPRFYGGAVGYMSYDMVRFFERLPEIAERDVHVYDSFFMIPEILLVFDNVSHVIKIIAYVYIQDGKQEEYKEEYKDAEKRILQIIERLKSPLQSKDNGKNKAPYKETDRIINESGKRPFKSNVSKEDFLKSIDRAKTYIRGGDIIQVVLSQRFETLLNVDPFNIYRALRIINPSPYMFYLRLDDTVLVGSSPEILVRSEKDTIVTRPIAGTRKRGKDEEDDKRLAKELLDDTKERAEHIMLVDLGRNDLGRVARTGSIKVDEFMAIEKYSHVMHIVSNVSGILKDGEDAYSVLRACFPAGTLTGAPKVRAMEIIEELEPHRRGIYGGSVGYFGFSGNMDMCITIRTLVIKDGKVYIQAGAGIVADSIPEREFEETVSKAQAMLKAMEMAREGLG